MKKSVNSAVLTFTHLKLTVMCVLGLAGAVPIASHAASATRTLAYTHDATTALPTKEITEPATSNVCLVKVYTYDGYGNTASATLRPCNGGTGEAAAPSGSIAISSRTSSLTYDSSGRFATGATDALSHSETRVYDTYTGLMTSLTGPNGLTTSWTYDGLGRKTQETRPDGTYTQWAYSFCSGVNGGSATCPTYGKYLVQTTVKNASNAVIAPISKIYYDALGREIRSESQGLSGTAIYKDTQYDSMGRVSQTSEPYYSGASPVWTQYQYDVLRRPTQVTAPNSSVTTMTYNGLTTSTTNAAGQTETHIKNSQGQLIEVDR